MKRGFTLIELLIVVSIIAILASIALVNFLEAQTRAKVSRAKTDMRTLATAVETYSVDNNSYPEILNMLRLTTPVAYITQLPVDVFAARPGALLGYANARQLGNQADLEQWDVTVSTSEQRAELASHTWFVWSNGPDVTDDALEDTQRAFYDVVKAPGADQGLYYDPTNGTISNGDLVRSARLIM